MNKAELWKAQLEFYPQSIELTEQEMGNWIRERLDGSAEGESYAMTKKNYDRAMSYAFSLLHPVRVYYRTSGRTDAWIGCRIGLEGPDYLSNYGSIDGRF